MSQSYIETNFPLGWYYLLENRLELENRENGKMRHNNFYAYIYPKNLVEFESVKIITPDIANKSQFTIDETGKLYHTTTVFSLSFNEKAHNNQYYYLGLLNSSLIWFQMLCNGNDIKGDYTRFHKQYMRFSE
jgi:hypothetical protein